MTEALGTRKEFAARCRLEGWRVGGLDGGGTGTDGD